MTSQLALKCFAIVLLTVTSLAFGETPLKTLHIKNSEAAGMSMFRAFWNTPVPLVEDGSLSVVDKVWKDKGQTAIWPAPESFLSKRDWRAQEAHNKGADMVFDALNRSMLLRFPDAAEKIAEQLSQGFEIEKVEVVFPYEDYELWPPGKSDHPLPNGYNYRMNWGIDKLYRERRPQWHAVAWALRKPWKSDPQTGPTLNAAVNGKIYWKSFGARDESEDRYPDTFGPTEISPQSKRGHMDITPLLTSSTFGAQLGERLRHFADCGLIVQKWEQWDHLYYGDPYEWATSTGPMGIRIRQPELKVTFKASEQVSEVTLPPKTDLNSLAEALQEAGINGKPQAVMPNDEQLREWEGHYRKKPSWASDWQWQRITELASLDPDSRINIQDPPWFWLVPNFVLDSAVKVKWVNKKKTWVGRPNSRTIYEKWVDQYIGRPVRGWSGFESAKEITKWHLGKDMLPEPAKEAFKRYWRAALRPEQASANSSAMYDENDLSGRMIYPFAQLDKKRKRCLYNERTGDWRGNKSFFRSGFNFTTSTQNFNTTAPAAALLAGTIIGSEHAMSDGRYGTEHFPMRRWVWNSGSGQECIDHYYFSVSMKGYKVLADYTEEPIDRMMTESILAKGMEEVIAQYHPNLKRFIAPSSRTSLHYLLGTQDGLQFILNTLSKKGTLTDVGVSEVEQGMKILGHEFKPLNVFLQTLHRPWGDESCTNMIDEKTFPYLAKHYMGRAMRTTYMSRDYGMSSSSTIQGRVIFMGQMRKNAEEVDSYNDLLTMDVKGGNNETRFASDAPGWIFNPGALTVYQHRNKSISVFSPRTYNGGFAGGKWAKGIKSTQASVGFFHFDPKTPLKIYHNGKLLETFPHVGKTGDHYVVQYGNSYVSITAQSHGGLKRKRAISIELGKSQQSLADKKVSHTAAFVFNAFLHDDDTALPTGDKAEKANQGTVLGADGQKLSREEAWMALDHGFVALGIEMADATQFDSLEAFVKHSQKTQLDIEFKDNTTAIANYHSGPDHLQLVTKVASQSIDKKGKWESPKANIQAMLHNGKDDRLPKDIARDTPFTQMGWEKAQKGGATLDSQKVEGRGRRVMLQYDAISGQYTARNPIPDLSAWNFSADDGRWEIQSDGLVGITSMKLNIKQHRLDIRHLFRERQASHLKAATCFLIRYPRALDISFNGQAVSKTNSIDLDGQSYQIIPLQEINLSNESIAQRVRMVKRARSTWNALAGKHYYKVDLKAGPFRADPEPLQAEIDFLKQGNIDTSAQYPMDTLEGYTNPNKRYPSIAKWYSSADLTSKITRGVGSLKEIPSINFAGHPFGVDVEKTLHTSLCSFQLQSESAQKIMMNLKVAGLGDKELTLHHDGKTIYQGPNDWSVHIDLNKGLNTFLLKVRQTSASRWGQDPVLEIGEPNMGLPLVKGVQWIDQNGKTYDIYPR